MSLRFLVPCGVVLGVLVMSGCKKNPDPRHIDLADFNSRKELSDTLRKWIPPGTRLTRVWETMQVSGFACGERAGTVIDTISKQVVSGKPYLECMRSTRRQLFNRRVWRVQFDFDSAGMTDVASAYFGERPQR